MPIFLWNLWYRYWEWRARPRYADYVTSRDTIVALKMREDHESLG